MNADEIRKYQLVTEYQTIQNVMDRQVMQDCAYFLREIAAQLAEQNALMQRDRIEALIRNSAPASANQILDDIGAPKGETLYDRYMAIQDKLQRLAELEDERVETT